jgi:hypothetical protein
LVAAGCSQLSPDFGNVYAISIQGTLAPHVEQGDTLSLKAQALDVGGAVLTDQPVFWAVLDTGTIGLTIDSTTGQLTGVSPDTVSVQAHVATLRSDPIRVVVTPLPDTVATTVARVVVPLASAESGGLLVQVLGLSSTGTRQPVGGKTVAYTIVSGTPNAANIFLAARATPADTLPGADPTRATAISSASGDAIVYVRKVAGQAPPDSAIVEATGLTARGAVVKGSPVRFTVVFLAS